MSDRDGRISRTGARGGQLGAEPYRAGAAAERRAVLAEHWNGHEVRYSLRWPRWGQVLRRGGLAGEGCTDGAARFAGSVKATAPGRCDVTAGLSWVA